MQPVEEEGSDLDALVELLYAETGATDVDAALVAKGASLFDEGSCGYCHSIDWETEGESGPNLGRRGSEEMLAAFLVEPGHPRWFGVKNEMPATAKSYSAHELEELVSYLIGLRSEPYATAVTTP